MITVTENAAGEFLYSCECGWQKTYAIKARGNCPRCKRKKPPSGAGRDDSRRTAAVRTEPAKLTPEQVQARTRFNEERRMRRISDRDRLAMPCAFLGPATGKRHKVGCVDKFLPEHACLCGERQMFLFKPAKAEVKPHHVRKPVAIPGGRCRDLQAKWGEVSCLDCPFYRAGLLPTTA